MAESILRRNEKELQTIVSSSEFRSEMKQSKDKITVGLQRDER